MDIVLEICAGSPASALAAQEGGAQRVELCDNLLEGGTTPSYGALALARDRLAIGLHALIRPRGGDFLYSELEFEQMARDIELCRRLGVDGVVLGLLTADGDVDVERTRQLAGLAGPLAVTFHRAFDMARDPARALEDRLPGVSRLGAGRGGQRHAPSPVGLVHGRAGCRRVRAARDVGAAGPGTGAPGGAGLGRLSGRGGIAVRAPAEVQRQLGG